MKKYQKINYKFSKKLRDDVLNGVYMPNERINWSFNISERRKK